MGRHISAGLALLLLLGFPGSGDATTVRSLPLAEVARRADRVVIARVAGSSCRLGVAPSGRPRPFTDYELVDLVEVAGTVATRNLLLPVVGGTVAGRRTRVPGAPVFEEGRRYLLFLKADEPFCGLVGWTQGAFRVEGSPSGGERVLTFAGAGIASVEGGRILEGAEGIPLGEFLDAVHEARRIPPAAPPPEAGGGPVAPFPVERPR